MFHLKCILYLFLIIQKIRTAKILSVFPTPSISHQVVFRPLMQELARRGHEVTVITTDPAFPKGQSPKNLIEIDVHDISYKSWNQFVESADGNEHSLQKQNEIYFALTLSIVIEQFTSDEVQKLINDKKQKFDLLFIEHYVRPAFIYSHVYKVPVISFSSFVGIYGTFESVGTVTHPFLYPIACMPKFYNLNLWEKIYQWYNHNAIVNSYESRVEEETETLKKALGYEIPNLNELKKNVHMTFLNTHAIWDNNRPVPPNLINLEGIHKSPANELPEDLKKYLNESTNGVIYMSFGTNTNTSLLSMEKVKIFMDVMAELPYNVLLKWGKTIPGCPKNVKIGRWFPQSDVLNMSYMSIAGHKNTKLFITQGGHQSTVESIEAGVPLIGIPIAGDQWYNTELYLRHEIGLTLDFATLTHEQLMSAIETIIKNESYRKNIIKIRTLLNDGPHTPLERAVWWTEHVLRHGGATHMRAAAAHMHWTEYYEIKLICVVFSTIIACFLLIVYLMKLVIRKLITNKLKIH